MNKCPPVDCGPICHGEKITWGTIHTATKQLMTDNSTLLCYRNTTMDDWDKVTVLRKKTPKAAQMRSESAVNQAIRSGQAVETQQKCEYSAFSAGDSCVHNSLSNLLCWTLEPY